jgi:heat shock protein HtpX
VAVTEGILRALSYEELEGVVAHEMGHIKNRDTLVSTVAASIAGAISMLANVGQWGLLFGGGRDREGGGNPFLGLAMIILAPMVAMLVQMAISRTREYGADKAAVETTGNPDAMASALRRIESFARNYKMPTAQGTQHMFIINPLTGGGMSELFSTHPPTEKRIAAIMELKHGVRSRNVPPPIPATR